MFRTTVGKLSKFERAISFLKEIYPAKTAEHVAADVGLKADTVRKWLDGTSKPNAGAFALLIFAYGPEFLTRVYERSPKWVDAALREERVAAIAARRAVLMSELQSLQGAAE